MNISDFINLIEAKFSERLNKKTGWGRNEIKVEFGAAIREALAAHIDDENRKKDQMNYYDQFKITEEMRKEDDHYRNMVDGPGDFRDGKL